MRITGPLSAAGLMIHKKFDETAVFELSRFCKIGCHHEEVETAHPGAAGTEVVQSCTLSVSVQIVAGRDDFAERGQPCPRVPSDDDLADMSVRAPLVAAGPLCAVWSICSRPDLAE